MDEKKIEPTDAMVDEAADAVCLAATDTPLSIYSGPIKRAYRTRASVALLAALNHPDARGLFTDEDARPWEPLSKGDPLNVGDEVRQDLCNVTVIAAVGRVDGEGDPWTAEDRFIGVLDEGTWYVRRTVQELPTEAEEIIVARSEDVDIEAVMDGDTWRAREAILGRDRRWFAVWRSGNRARLFASPEDITPGTWKVDDQ